MPWQPLQVFYKSVAVRSRNSLIHRHDPQRSTAFSFWMLKPILVAPITEWQRERTNVSHMHELKRLGNGREWIEPFVRNMRGQCIFEIMIIINTYLYLLFYLTFSQRSKNKQATVSRPWVNTITESFSETHCPYGSVSTENHRHFKHWCYSLLDGKQINWFSENKLKYPNIFLVFPERKWQCLSDYRPSKRNRERKRASE